MTEDINKDLGQDVDESGNFIVRQDEKSEEHETPNPESESISSLELTIDGQNYRIETTRSVVDYPQHVQQETGGVLGHERASVAWEEIAHLILKLNEMEDFKVDNLEQIEDLLQVSRLVKNAKLDGIKIPDEIIKNGTISDLCNLFPPKENAYLRYCKRKGFDPQNPDTSNKGYISEEDFYKKLEKSEKSSLFYHANVSKTEALLRIFETNPAIDLNDKIEKFANIPNAEITRKILEQVLEQVFSRLSGDHFIKDTYNHYSRGIMPSIYKKQKMFLQKIDSPEFHTETISSSDFNTRVGKYFNYVDIKTNEPKTVNDSKWFSTSGTQGLKEEFTEERKNSEIQKLRNIRQLLTEKNMFLLTLESHGLDVQGGDVWSEGSKYLRLIDTNIYGFSISNKAFEKYMKEVNEIFEEAKKYCEGSRFALAYLREKAIAVDPSPNSNEARKIQASIFNKTSSQDPLLAHESIPICIGHPDIPELRWCHAQYASIPTKKGLNFLTFKS